MTMMMSHWKMSANSLIVIALCATAFFHHCASAPEADLITALPGLSTPPPFKQYSGYLSADQDGDKQLHYWFVESSSNPRTDPLVLWLNGGPGCSSLLGIMTENGPYRLVNESSVQLHPFTWNQAANMIFMESPAGVGFSYAKSGNTQTNDSDAASQNTFAVLDFYKKFPEYADHDFYITGESYGGIYVPTLAARIVNIPSIKLKGFAVGNGLSDYRDNENSLLYFAYFHGLIGDKDWDYLRSECCHLDADNRCDFVQAGAESHTCQSKIEELSAIVSDGGLDVYNLYAECAGGVNTGLSTEYNTDTGMFHSTYMGWPFSWTSKARLEMQKRKLIPKNKLRLDPPCTDFKSIEAYFSRDDVKQALHVSPQAQTWTPCSGSLQYDRTLQTVKPYYLKAIQHKLRMLVYNGDIDMACNFMGDEWFVNRLPLKNAGERKMWYYKAADGTKQVAGFVKTFDLMSLVTVRGSGHMVPTDRPRPALEMFINFIQDQPFA